MEWTLGFVLAEVEIETAEADSAEANIDSSMLGELPQTTSAPTLESARNHADYTATAPTSDLILDAPVAQPATPRAPAISAEDALRYIQVVNEVIARVENTVGEFVAQAKSVKAQCESVLQRFVKF